MTTTTITRAVPRSSDTEVPARTTRSEHNRAGWMFALPFLVIYVLFLIGPVLIGLVVSFFNTATVSPGLGDWVGIDNYADVLTSSDFWASMWPSVLFTLLTTPLLVLLPLLFAMFAARVTRNRWFFRVAFFAPY